jgi:hypothetical protein
MKTQEKKLSRQAMVINKASGLNNWCLKSAKLEKTLEQTFVPFARKHV